MRSKIKDASAMLPADADTLAEIAYSRIKEMIISQELSPGSLISETRLSEHLNLGRTPVREGLKRLNRDRLVRIMPRRGVIVSEIDISEQMLALEVRRPLERLLVTRAARRSTAVQRRRFHEIAQQCKAALRAKDGAAYLRLDAQYDDLIDQCAGNRYATDALRPMHDIGRRFWGTMHGSESWSTVGRLHIDIIEAVSTGDHDRAAEASDIMMNFNEKIFRELLQ